MVTGGVLRRGMPCVSFPLCSRKSLRLAHGIRGNRRVRAPESLNPLDHEEERLLHELDADRLPQHIAVIMDGNGRWAQRRHLPRVSGHSAGVQSARTVIETCAKLGIQALTLYAFSLENWRRPKAEIDFLMRLLREYLRKELPTIHRNNIRLLVIGRPDQLPDEVRADTERAMEQTAKNTGMSLAVALNYGGRAELVDAFNRILDRVRHNGLANAHVDEEMMDERELHVANRIARPETVRAVVRNLAEGLQHEGLNLFLFFYYTSVLGLSDVTCGAAGSRSGPS